MFSINRKIAAIVLVLIIWLTLLWTFIIDFGHKQAEEKQRLVDEIREFSIKALNYKLEFTSFNMTTKSITGVLSLKKGMPQWDESKIYYAPLTYVDDKGGFGIPYTRSILNLRNIIPLATFTEKIPEPVNVRFEAIGNPELYPFDRYYIAGKVQSLAYIEQDNKKNYLNKEQKNESLSIKNSIKGLFMRSLNENDLQNISAKIKIAVNELKIFNSSNDSFILVVERPQFIRDMTIIFGVIALLSAFVIGTKVSLENISINIIGYILGLWSIRSILLGEQEIFLPYLDYFILSCYLILLTCVLFRVISGTIGMAKDKEIRGNKGHTLISGVPSKGQ